MPRSYKQNWQEHEMLDYLQKNRGIKLDPFLLDLFFADYDLTRTIRRRSAND